MIETWEALFGSWLYLTARVVYSACAVLWFWYAGAGWGDAAWDDERLHPGRPDDLWHKRRRIAFWLISTLPALPFGLFWADAGMLLAYGVVAAFTRKAFRMGVWDASPVTFGRWFGPKAKPLIKKGFRPL